MTRRRNVQHGQRRRIPAALWPSLILVALMPFLVWELVLLLGSSW